MIYKKLHTIQKSIRAMAKDTKAFNYDYLKGDTLLAHIRPQMDELGLMCTMQTRHVDLTPITYRKYDKGARAVIECTEVLASVALTFTWVDVEDGETIEHEWHGTGMNNFDKGFGSALTYAERYYFLKLFHIATDRDDVDYIAATRDEAIEMAKQVPARPQMTEELFRKMVSLEAKGVKAKSGKTYRQEWIDSYAPTDAEIAVFDADVESLRDPFKSAE